MQGGDVMQHQAVTSSKLVMVVSCVNERIIGCLHLFLFLEDLGLDLGAKALMPFFHECSVYVCSNKDENLHAHADVQDLAAFAMLKALKLVSM